MPIFGLVADVHVDVNGELSAPNNAIRKQRCLQRWRGRGEGGRGVSRCNGGIVGDGCVGGGRSVRESLGMSEGKCREEAAGSGCMGNCVGDLGNRIDLGRRGSVLTLERNAMCA